MADLEGGDAAEVINAEPIEDGVLVLRLTGELDIVAVDALGPRLDHILHSDVRRVVADASALAFMDSCGIALLLRVAARFGAVEVLHASEIIQETILASGAAEHLRIVPEAP